jgi:hypothetical protein
MTVTVSKPAVNIREELNSLRKPTGITGSQLLAANTTDEVFRVIGNSGFKNLIQNGDFRVAQRGTSVSFTGGQVGVDAAYSLDRWYNGYYYNGGSFSPAWTISQQADHPLGSGLCMQVYTDTGANPGNGLLNQLSVQQTFEAQNMFHIAGPNAQPTTLSFWVKSNKPGVYGVQIRMRGGANNPIIMKRYQILQSGVWEYKTITFPAQTLNALSNTGNGSGGFISFTLSGAWSKNGDAFIGNAEDTWYNYSSNAICFVDQTNLVQTAGNYIKFADVQYEVGTVATPFERRTYQQELAICQRYYERIVADPSSIEWRTGHGYNTNIYMHIPWKVRKRSNGGNATFSAVNASSIFNFYGNSSTAGNIAGLLTGSPTVSYAGHDGMSMYATLTAGTYTPYGTAVLWGFIQNQWVDYSAELTY